MRATRAVATTHAARGSFVERARAGGVPSLLGPFRSAGLFDAPLENALLVLSLSDGLARCQMTVGAPHANAFASLHGACAALLVDVVGTLALLSLDCARPGVSVEMNQSFLRAAPVGSLISIEGRVLKYGKKLGFTEVTIRNAGDEVVALGRHTKAFQ